MRYVSKQKMMKNKIKKSNSIPYKIQHTIPTEEALHIYVEESCQKKKKFVFCFSFLVWYAFLNFCYFDYFFKWPLFVEVSNSLIIFDVFLF